LVIFGPRGLKGTAKHCRIWHSFIFVKHIGAKPWVIVTLQGSAALLPLLLLLLAILTVVVLVAGTTSRGLTGVLLVKKWAAIGDSVHRNLSSQVWPDKVPKKIESSKPAPKVQKTFILNP
jgi:hypothetical protein